MKKKAFAKKILVVVLVLLWGIQVATLFACQKKDPSVLVEAYVYGAWDASVEETTRREIEEYFRSKGQDDFVCTDQSGDFSLLTRARICSIEDAPSKVRFVTDEPDVVPEGYDGIIVTSKWMYFSALVGTPAIKGVRNNVDAEIAVYGDQYCMEQVVLHPELYRCTDLSHPDCKRVEIEPELENVAFSRGEYCNGYLAEPLFLHPREAYIAAMYRYGLTEFSFDDLCPATMYMRSVTDQYGVTPIPPMRDIVPCYSIVGYVETEADKLLSKGVSMDKNSRAYKIVAEQLRHPIFYVSNNDQLQGVRYVETE